MKVMPRFYYVTNDYDVEIMAGNITDMLIFRLFPHGFSVFILSYCTFLDLFSSDCIHAIRYLDGGSVQTCNVLSEPGFIEILCFTRDFLLLGRDRSLLPGTHSLLQMPGGIL